jgi:D-aspartate ligase
VSSRRPVNGPWAAQLAVDTPILVLGLAGLSMHHGALGIARSAGRLGIRAFCAHGGETTALLRSRYWQGQVRLSSADTDPQKLSALLEFGREHDGAILIPVDDESAMFVEANAPELARLFRFPRQPAGLVHALASKREMHRLCLEHDVPTPHASFPRSRADVTRHAENSGFPIVLKRIDASIPATQQAPSVRIARDRDELLDAYELMESPQEPNVLLQEYIPGTPATIWMFNGYFDGQSNCTTAFTGQKIRQSPPDTGATTLGVCRPNAVVEHTTRRLMKAIGYRGILDIGYRWDERDGQYKLLDVNPRIGATFRLFVASNGIDVLRALYLDLTGQAIPDADQRQERRWLVEPLDLRSSLTYLRRRDVGVAEWAGSFRGVEETAWWARDDPRPFLAAIGSLSRGYLGKRVRPT